MSTADTFEDLFKHLEAHQYFCTLLPPRPVTAYPIAQVEAEEPAKVCDCGAVKCKTTHADWCASVPK
jgi:hypothetical protein